MAADGCGTNDTVALSLCIYVGRSILHIEIQTENIHVFVSEQ
jgi:hypothetical protein